MPYTLKFPPSPQCQSYVALIVDIREEDSEVETIHIITLCSIASEPLLASYMPCDGGMMNTLLSCILPRPCLRPTSPIPR
ncbi:hypothetical protein PAXRUDRAFT_664376 [Paxillus rubicundulus Ve08.2h10]|uniref:Uncharacterized protein n=1 Tax=Paxillus rubicundulus Ve08.2h10 TaxID=930991 RepID=A0A0D0DV92_9AGAM|nr:hypothetical protein PAXRUDRAFT_664376 [Paxillus rubicundulus Ve08.2h10]